MVFFQFSTRRRGRRGDDKKGSSGGYLNDMPHEAIGLIFEHLPLRDLLTARQLCKHVKPVADELVAKQMTKLNLHPSPKSIRVAREICNHPFWSQYITELVVVDDHSFMRATPVSPRLQKYAPWPVPFYEPRSKGWSASFAPRRPLFTSFDEIVSDLTKLPRLRKLSFAQQASIPSFNPAPRVPPSERRENDIHSISHAEVLVKLLSSRKLTINDFAITAEPKVAFWMGNDMMVPINELKHNDFTMLEKCQAEPGSWAQMLEHLESRTGIRLRKLSVSLTVGGKARPHMIGTIGYFLELALLCKIETVVLESRRTPDGSVSCPAHPIQDTTSMLDFLRLHRPSLQEFRVDNIFIGSRHREAEMDCMIEFLECMQTSPGPLIPPKFSWRINRVAHAPDCDRPDSSGADSCAGRYCYAYHGGSTVQALSEVARSEGVEVESSENATFWDFGKAASVVRNARRCEDRFSSEDFALSSLKNCLAPLDPRGIPRKARTEQ